MPSDDRSSLAVDAEAQMGRFVAKTLRVCTGLVLLTLQYLGTEAVVAVTGEVALIIELNADLGHKNTYSCFLELRVVSGAVSLPNILCIGIERRSA